MRKSYPSTGFRRPVQQPVSKSPTAQSCLPEPMTCSSTESGGIAESFVLRCTSSVASRSVAFALGRSSPKDTLRGVFQNLGQEASSTRFLRMRQRLARNLRVAPSGSKFGSA